MQNIQLEDKTYFVNRSISGETKDLVFLKDNTKTWSFAKIAQDILNQPHLLRRNLNKEKYLIC